MKNYWTILSMWCLKKIFKHVILFLLLLSTVIVITIYVFGLWAYHLNNRPYINSPIDGNTTITETVSCIEDFRTEGSTPTTVKSTTLGTQNISIDRVNYHTPSAPPNINKNLFGLMHVIDYSLIQDFYGNEKVNWLAVLWSVLLCAIWGGWGAVLTSLLFDYITNKHKQHYNGLSPYPFKEHYYLIIGWDFQVPQLVEAILAYDLKQKRKNIRHKRYEIIIITAQDCAALNDQLKVTIPKDSNRKLIFIQKSDYTNLETYEMTLVSNARKIFIIGDENNPTRDISNLRVLDLLKPIIIGTGKQGRTKLYLHISDTILFNKIRRENLLTKDERKSISLSVFNYYDSWVWYCLSTFKRDSNERAFMDYRPLAFRRRCNYRTNKTHLYVIGFGDMGQNVVRAATAIMNYGNRRKGLSKIVIFDPHPNAQEVFDNFYDFKGLPEVEIVFVPISGVSARAQNMILQSAQNIDTSTTVMIDIHNPHEALQYYYALSKDILKENISVNIWQKTQSTHLPNTINQLKTGASYAHVTLFGMLDILPWYNDKRVSLAMSLLNVNNPKKTDNEIKDNWYNSNAENKIAMLTYAITLREILSNNGYTIYAPYNEEELDEIKRFKNYTETNLYSIFSAFLKCSIIESKITTLSLRNIIRREANIQLTERIINGNLSSICTWGRTFREGIIGNFSHQNIYANKDTDILNFKSNGIAEAALWNRDFEDLCVEELQKYKIDCIKRERRLVCQIKFCKRNSYEFFWHIARKAQIPIIAVLPTPKKVLPHVDLWRLRGCESYSSRATKPNSIFNISQAKHNPLVVTIKPCS